jgi:uncharacterized repeat protein (TIGR03803 family)
MRKLPAFLAISYTLLAISLPVRAQYTNLHSFNGTFGSDPLGNVTLYNGMLYGMTPSGGSNGVGCIFSVDTNGNNFRDLLDFSGNNGENPAGSLFISGRTIYGMTQTGGLGGGNLFAVDTDGTGSTNLINFNGTNGEEPDGAVILSGKTLYGMAVYGGANNLGCIFSIDTDGTRYTDLFDFNGTNGEQPSHDLVLSGTQLFGVTHFGGANNDGRVFSIDTDGSAYKDLLDFNGTNGNSPFGTLTIFNNVLFGTTQVGGANSDGCVFSIDTDGSRYRDLYDFNGTEGRDPYGSVICSGGRLYGMTEQGIGATAGGNVFSVDTGGGGYQDLLNFNGTNGEYPEGSLTLSGNVIYGMTSFGGTSNDGVIFRLDTTIVTSVKQLSVVSSQLSVYPNPGNGIFTIQSSVVSGQWSVEIYNVLGEQVYSKSYQPLATSYQPITFDLSSQPSGIYLYKVIANSGELIGEGKIVIEK